MDKLTFTLSVAGCSQPGWLQQLLTADLETDNQGLEAELFQGSLDAQVKTQQLFSN